MKILIVGEDEFRLSGICLHTPPHYEFTFAENLNVALEASPEAFDLVFIVTNGNFRENVRSMHGHFQEMGLVEQFHQRVRFLEEAPSDWRRPISTAMQHPNCSWQR